MSNLRQRVERGAAMLDKKRRSPAWRGKIDLETLAIEDGCRCVLGQLYGNYVKGEERLGLITDADKAIHLGLVTWAQNPRPLTRAWVRYIEATR